MSFAGRTVVVTGGTRGIGAAITSAFLAEGARVLASYHSNDAAAEAFAADSDAAEGQLTLHRFDVADAAAVEAFWGEIEEAETSVDALVNNSGIRSDSLLATMNLSEWQRVIDTNLTGSYLMSKHAVLNMMRQRYGRILFVTSPAGRFGFEGQGNYAASKAGQVGLMRSLCKEVARRKITVNCVSPGFIATELIADLPEDLAKEYKRSVPMRRFGEPSEVADAVLFLASERASYVTGTTLEVTGGL
ncbi:MAG: SDR family oxidoreductase [bacterium]|nr:SDR family oxidoreductase [bacterium]